jgi:serine/threonine-protein kinase
VSGNDLDVSLGNAERVRKQLNQFGIRRSVHGRGVEADKQGVVARASRPGPTGAWNDANVDEHAIRAGRQHHYQLILALFNHDAVTLTGDARLGPYELLEPLGSGAMGEVWKARDTRLGRFVAIKRLIRHSERFEHEARAIAALNHQHICQIHDVGPDYLVLEYIEGRQVQGPLPEQEALRFAIQIASALEHAHRRGLLHRDLKPANILVTPQGEAKLLDFGIAKLVNSDAEVTLTGGDAVIGTAAYMSPEQADGQPLDARSDIFSFGAVLYELLSGGRAFTGRTAVQVLNAILRHDPPRMEGSPALERVVRRCLEKHPEDRFQSAADLRMALEQITSRPLGEPHSIAVLPFANMTADKENEYFSDGLAEEIINVLAHIPGLKVTARTSAFSFRGKEQDIRRIAETLRVRTILEGSVRRAGNRIRVTAQLVDASDGYHLWSERYDRELSDVFAIQDEIARAIATALEVKLSAGPATQRRHTPSIPAYEAFLKARYHRFRLTPGSLARCKDYYEQAIALDPNFALAHGELGLTFVSIAINGTEPAHDVMPLLRAAAQRALEIDPDLPEAHAGLGTVAAIYDYDWKEADRRFRLATARDPVPPEVRHLYGFFCLLLVGRAQEAVDQHERALQSDPLNLLFRMALGVCLRAAGRGPEGTTELQKVVELDENHVWALISLGLGHASRGKFDEALPFAEKAYVLAAWNATACGLLSGVLSRLGHTERSEQVLENLLPGLRYGAARGLTVFYLLTGDVDQAADWMVKSIEQRDPGVMIAPGKTLRSSPRWPAIAKMMNLAEPT